MWEEIQVLQLFPDPRASASRYFTPPPIFGDPGVAFRLRGCFGEDLDGCSAASLFITYCFFGWPIRRTDFGADVVWWFSTPVVFPAVESSRCCVGCSIDCPGSLGTSLDIGRAANPQVSPGRCRSAGPGTSRGVRWVSSSIPSRWGQDVRSDIGIATPLDFYVRIKMILELTVKV